MYRCVSNEEINIFNKSARIVIGGRSGAGKSFFVSKLIRKYRSCFDHIIAIGSDLENVNDLNVIRNDDFRPFDNEIDGNILLIYDDIIYEKHLMQDAAKVFVKGRHLNLSAIILVQNLFLDDKNFRIISLNANYFCLMGMRDLNQLTLFAKTFLTKQKIQPFVELYRKIVSKQKHSYLLVDFTKDFDDPLSIRACVNKESYEKAYEF